MLAALSSFLMLAASIAQRAPAQDHKVTIHLNPARTEIHWTLGATLHSVHGTFGLTSGVLTFDPATGAAQGDLVVDLSSGESGDARRDRTMRDRVLEVARYPQAHFYPSAVHWTEKSNAAQVMTAAGRFSIHGSDHPMELRIDLHVNGTVAVGTTHFQVPYVEWGMHDPSTWLLHVSKVVDVDVTSEATVDAP